MKFFFRLRARSLNLVSCLVWILTEADPETRIQVQEAYLRGDPRNTSSKVGWDREEKEADKGYVLQQVATLEKSLFYLGVGHSWKKCRTRASELSNPNEKKVGCLSISSLQAVDEGCSQGALSPKDLRLPLATVGRTVSKEERRSSRVMEVGHWKQDGVPLKGRC